MSQLSQEVNVEASLMLALIECSQLPLLLLDGHLRVIAASESFYRAFEIDSRHSVGRPFTALGAGEWGRPQITSLLSATASGLVEIPAYEMDLRRPSRESRSVIISARKLDYVGQQVRIVVTVADVTDARAAELLKDNLLREKEILLREVQHRVANSLQIISSILLQSARNIQSEETRSHLYNAHNRVMSVAEVQKQLAVTCLGAVDLRSYFTELCRSIANSLIHDPDQLLLTVSVDDSETDSDTSISLGLIVTELVINAIKHAFPGHRNGTIEVDYHSLGRDWTLSVRDDGIGMPTGPNSPKPGLGTGIVEALARQLDGKLDVTNAKPGTLVSLTALPIAGASRFAP
ncbi:MAG: histidine kinase dimerization/phosphoacceptor domain -containing protein [Devosia sp.]